MRERCGGFIGTAVLILCAIAVGLGMFFRLHDLSKPTPYEDEAMTWLRVSGYSEAEFNARLYDGRFHTIGEIAAFQRHNSEHDLGDTVRVLARDDPQHAPLYYALERWWSGIAGDSLAAKRVPSALSGIGLIAAFALLCRVLFGSNLAAMLGAALVALSPLHIAYAQQAREYELWVLCICLSSAALIAERPFAYFFAAVTALYASVLSLIVMAAQGVWLLVARRRVRAFGFSAAAALLAYAPWLVNLTSNRSSAFDANTWSATPWPPLKIAEKWAFNLSTTFFDLTYANTRYAVVGGIILLFVLFAFAETLKRFPRSVGAYVILLTAACAATFLLPDLLLHEHRSTVSRYVLPTFIGVELAVAGAFAARLSERRNVASWLLSFAVLLGLGAWSAGVRETHASWWENNKDARLPAIASVLNADVEQPLIAEDGTTILALSNILDPKIRFVMVATHDDAWKAAAQPGAYILTPSPALRRRVEQHGLHLVSVVETGEANGLEAFRASLKPGSTEIDPADTPSLWRVVSQSGA